MCASNPLILHACRPHFHHVHVGYIHSFSSFLLPCINWRCVCVCACVCVKVHSSLGSILLNPHCSALTVTVILKINLCPFSFCCLGTRNLLSIIFALCIIKKMCKNYKKNFNPNCETSYTYIHSLLGNAS